MVKKKCKLNLDYFTLLSPEPVSFQNVGSIKSPTLREVSRIGYMTYQGYLSLLLLDTKSYLSALKLHGITQYESMNFFDILIYDKSLRTSVCNALNFFMTDDVSFDEEHNVFFTFNSPVEGHSQKQPTGIIHSENYADVTDVILQRVNIRRNNTDYENVKIKNKTAAHLLEKIKKGSEKSRKKEDKKLSLANIISSLASHHKSINMINIWDLTVYQLYDQFNRQRLNDCYDIQSLHIAAWGNSEGKFDDTQWFSLMNEY